MKSTMLKTAVLSMTLLTAGCVGQTPIIASASGCSDLVPDSMKDAVRGAPAPQFPTRDVMAPNATDIDRLEAEVAFLEESLREAGNFAVAQTGQLTKANDEKIAAQEIIERCEARDKEAIESARPKFFGLF